VKDAGGLKMSEIVQHHVKYKEIHGKDEIVLLTKGAHRALHNRLRREGRCNIPSDILAKISDKARGRTLHAKQYLKNYRLNNEYEFSFLESVYPDIQLYEKIRYNRKIGTVSFRTGFAQFRGQKLYYISQENI